MSFTALYQASAASRAKKTKNTIYELSPRHHVYRTLAMPSKTKPRAIQG
jgi:hypothetical protein